MFNFRLGNLSCLADPDDLLVYKDTVAFTVIQDMVMDCTRGGLSLPSHLVRTENLKCDFSIVFVSVLYSTI